MICCVSLKNITLTFANKLRWLMIKFDTYKKLSNPTMRQHLSEMENLIRELKTTR